MVKFEKKKLLYRCVFDCAIFKILFSRNQIHSNDIDFYSVSLFCNNIFFPLRFFSFCLPISTLKYFFLCIFVVVRDGFLCIFKNIILRKKSFSLTNSTGKKNHKKISGKFDHEKLVRWKRSALFLSG